jgi:N-methylhydantoinase B
VCRDLRILGSDTVLTVRSARQKFPAPGKNGGLPGKPGAYLLNPGTAGEKKLHSTFSEMPLGEGDLLRILTPGGGGLGKPAGRPREEVDADVREGKVTAEAARELYN